MKKGQGLTMSTIVIAVISVLVLVVLALIFTGNLGNFGSEVADCANKGGTCKLECGPSEATLGSAQCDNDPITDESRTCCVATQ